MRDAASSKGLTAEALAEATGTSKEEMERWLRPEGEEDEAAEVTLKQHINKVRVGESVCSEGLHEGRAECLE